MRSLKHIRELLWGFPADRDRIGRASVWVAARRAGAARRAACGEFNQSGQLDTRGRARVRVPNSAFRHAHVQREPPPQKQRSARQIVSAGASRQRSATAGRHARLPESGRTHLRKMRGGLRGPGAHREPGAPWELLCRKQAQRYRSGRVVTRPKRQAPNIQLTAEESRFLPLGGRCQRVGG